MTNNIITITTSLEDRKRITFEWVQDLQKKAKEIKARPFVKKDVEYKEPFWVALDKQQKELKTKQQTEAQAKSPDLKELFKLVEEKGLQYSNPGQYQHRVKNVKTHEYVDWYDGKKRSMRRIDGTFTTQGENREILLEEVIRL